MSPAWLVLLSLCSADATPAWPAFLGQGASAVEANSLPLEWSPTKNIAWEAAIPGHGQSSPIVWGDRVFVTSVEGDMKDTNHVLAFSLADGKQLWKDSFESSDKVKNSLYVSRAAPTPVTDGKNVYAFFESGDVVAISMEGTELWRKSLSTEFGKFKTNHGLSASPVLFGDAVIVLIEHDGPSYLIALNTADGKTKWKTDRTSRTSWSSPALVKAGESMQVVCSSSGSVDGYDAATGKQLWTYEEVGGNTSSTPVQNAAGSFLVGASAGREAERADLAKKSNLAMMIDIASGKPEPKVLWRNEQASPTFGSPMAYGGQAYWVNRSGVVYCLDAASGESNYTQRIKQSCWATPVGFGDRVYFFGKDGHTTVIRSGAKFEVLAENQLWDPAAVKPDPAKGANEDTPEKRAGAANFAGATQYGVAVVNGSLLIRTGEKLFCLRTSQ
ncbi:outer membrane protein assembly factor BamB family protein [Anatilimnocola floriformis]|uniref:outer membrane protein assembly factor BamB family protein n=1 Tax=Anatilimnocola floriformis TaxID=2948575 RepID=UPI0020C2EA34|nr:PQQ-binding-like beta-propeller repeat protein [Anatilimnocola floriformis]